MGLTGIGSLAACADPVIVDEIPDGGSRGDMQTDGGPSAVGLWSAAPAVGPALISEGPSVDARRRYKRDPYYIKDSAGTQYLFISGSDYATESWSVSYFSQASGTITSSSAWASAVAGTAGTWYSGDITGPAVRSASDRTLYFAANAATTDVNRTRPDFVFQIGRASYNGIAYQPAATPVVAAATFSGNDVNATPLTPRPDAYGMMDPWIVDDGAANPTMYYTGLDCSATCKFQILRTVSTDGGLSFPAGTVVLSGRTNNVEEAGGVASPSVVLRNGQYVLAYTAVKTVPTKSRTSIREALATGSIDVAISTDGSTFKPGSASGAPVIGRSGTYREFGSTSPSLYLDTTNVLRSYFAGYQMSGSSESYNIGTADWLQNQ